MLGWLSSGTLRPRSLKMSSEEDVERGGRLKRLDQEALGGGVRVLGDVGSGIVEHPAGLFSPDYAAPPRSHFRRIALSTTSWEATRPAPTSA